MDIQNIVRELEKRGVSITATALESFLAEQNIAAADVTAADLDEIAAELAPKAIAVAPKGGKATKAPKRESRKTRTTPATALSVAAKNTQTELGAVIGVISAGADQLSTQTANEMLDIIREVPNVTLQKFAELVQVDQPDAAHFQSAANELAAAVFGFVPGDAA